jgi:hypothetical protein
LSYDEFAQGISRLGINLHESELQVHCNCRVSRSGISLVVGSCVTQLLSQAIWKQVESGSVSAQQTTPERVNPKVLRCHPLSILVNNALLHR